MCSGFQKGPLGLRALSKDLRPHLEAQGEVGGASAVAWARPGQEVGNAHLQDIL